MIVIIGLGAVGTHVIDALKSYSLRLYDRDIVEKQNIGIQKFYSKIDVPKAFALREFGFEAHDIDIDASSIKSIGTPSLVIECSDNILTRQIINAYCHKNKIPFLSTGAIKNKGYVASFYQSPCYRSIQKGSPELEQCTAEHLDKSILPKIAQRVKVIVEQFHQTTSISKEYWRVQKNISYSIKALRDCPICSKHDYSILEAQPPLWKSLCAGLFQTKISTEKAQMLLKRKGIAFGLAKKLVH